MSFVAVMQPAGLGLKGALSEGDVALASAVEADEQAQLQKIEEQAAVLLREAENILHLSRQLMEQSHGEAHDEASQARGLADVMRSSADKARHEIQAARTQSRGGKANLSKSQISSISMEMGACFRLCSKEKAALEKASAEYRAQEVAADAARKASPSIAQTAVRVVTYVSSASVAAVVGPPVFHAMPIYSLGAALDRVMASGAQMAEGMSAQWNRASHALEHMAQEVMQSAPVMQVRAFGRAAWQQAQQIGHTVAEGVEAFVAAPVETTKKAAQIAMHKAAEVKDEALRLADEYVAKPVAKATNAAVKGAKHAYQRAGEVADKAMDEAGSALTKVKQAASNLWPWGDKAPVNASKDKPAPVAAAVNTSKMAGIGTMAQAMQQSAMHRLPQVLFFQSVSPAHLLSPTKLEKTDGFTSVLAGVGLKVN